MDISKDFFGKPLTAAAALLARGYECYWPAYGHGDPNERELTTAMAGALLQRPEFTVYAEVPLKAGASEKVDLLALAPDLDLGWIIESKNIESPKMRGGVLDDWDKLRRFRLRNSMKEPGTWVRMCLMRGWTDRAMPGDPFEKVGYGRLVARLATLSPDLLRDHRLIRSLPHASGPYCHQWLMYAAEVVRPERG